MNQKQIIILIIAFVVSAIIVWHDLPIEFPWIVNLLMLFVKLSIVVALTIFASMFAGRKNKSS